MVHWATEFYKFRENELAIVELVVQSNFEVPQITIRGIPRHIPNNDPTHYHSLEVLGPQNLPGNGAKDAALWGIFFTVFGMHNSTKYFFSSACTFYRDKFLY